ncbi:MAG TPA: metallophosphoesterase [Opitutaceae bacterium]|jgi:predicted MPP superfamily phosphohydrolase
MEALQDRRSDERDPTDICLAGGAHGPPAFRAGGQAEPLSASGRCAPPAAWRRILAVALLLAAAGPGAFAANSDVTFVLTSDVHFGITRPRFRGQNFVNSTVVNAALVDSLNALPSQSLPSDGGLRAGQPIAHIDFVAITGDLANRQELYPVHIQSAATSWKQFEQCYIDGLKLGCPLYLVPGNHDLSDAIGYPAAMVPRTDPTSMVEIYNRMMRPAVPLTNATFQFPRDRVIYSRDVGGAHLIFLTIWPDRSTRAWIDRDLEHVAAVTPVFIFCHDPVQVDPKHLINPLHDHTINREDGYENLLTDVRAETTGKATPAEDRELAAFLRRHRNIVAYFHGHENYHEAYTWTGPGHDLNLHVFRADSPMKGRSRKDEFLMSYEVITYNVPAGRLTDREYRWNTPEHWGQTTTVDIAAPQLPKAP